MISTSRRLFACIAIILVALGGCASSSQRSTIAKDPLPQDSFERGSTRAPTAKTLYSMARILQIQGKDTDAEYVLRRIIKEYPDFPPAYCGLAETLIRQRRMDESMKVLLDGIKIAPRDTILLNNLGMCSMLRGDYEASLGYFTKAAAIDPNDTRFRSNMAVSLGMMGRYKEAFSLYQQVLSLADAHYNIAVIAQARKDHARAAREYRQAESLRALAARDQAAGAGSGGRVNRLPADGQKSPQPVGQLAPDNS